eukprot:scaffold3061_cov430-Prasinococcus_capsulatus_cf.AAC.7
MGPSEPPMLERPTPSPAVRETTPRAVGAGAGAGVRIARRHRQARPARPHCQPGRIASSPHQDAARPIPGLAERRAAGRATHRGHVMRRARAGAPPAAGGAPPSARWAPLAPRSASYM